ncbi:hypothetical protein BGZ65_000110 [Modicella reniformis]|uniref:Crinkler effector protein N-terminal domain-containing protein n=1 Tax=Modicella reniformis TaxID=1440133 RepID=A0A9P6MAC9_9FUNG|nr:hypothetical protein BGZ65_000110 [Modicella reniformis]
MVNKLRIWCVVDGESASFPVDNFPADGTVGHLKKAIKEEKPNDFANVDADKLTLWKVSLSDICDEQPILLESEIVKDKSKLSSKTPLSQVFPQEPRDDDYIIAQLPQPDGIMDVIRKLQKILPLPPKSDPVSISASITELMPCVERPMEKPYPLYMMLDFNSELALEPFESKYKAETILALRIVYFYFFQGCQGGFQGFLSHTKTTRSLFTINNAIFAISQHLNLKKRPLFLFIHIDEFQKIFEYRWEAITDGKKLAPLPDNGIQMAGKKNRNLCNKGACLFQDMMRCLGSYMSGISRACMIQPFLSGTARAEVVKIAEPTFYAFHFLNCPMLSVGACYSVMGHFAQQFKVPYSDWKMEYFHLISATGGLPRALEFLLTELLDPHRKKLKLDHVDFKSQTHTILESNEGLPEKVFIRIPYFFLRIYNNATRVITGDLDYAFLRNWNEQRDWAYFERFIAAYEVFRTNFLVDCSDTDMKLRDFYQGALGHQTTLDRDVRLKKVTLMEAAHRFPQNVRKKRKKTGQDMDIELSSNWSSNIVIKNAAGASFGDVCVCRENAKGEKKTLFALQREKWNDNNVTPNIIRKEHQMNLETIERLDPEIYPGIKDAQLVTVMITTSKFSGDESMIPQDCLLIHEGNFAQYFGNTFSLHAALSIAKDSNWNFLTRDFLKDKLPQETVNKFFENMPY